MTEPTEETPPAPAVPTPAWQSLSPWTVPILSIRSALQILTTTAVFLLSLGERLTRELAALGDGQVGRLAPWVIVAAIVIGILRAIVRWLTTRYVLDDHRICVRSGLLFQRRTSVVRSRIRHGAIGDGLLSRPCRVAQVTFGTADSSSDVSVKLMFVPRNVAEALREAVLGDSTVVHTRAGQLARARPSWSLWAPFSALSVSIWVGVYAVVYQVFFAWLSWLRTLLWLRVNEVALLSLLRSIIVIPIIVGIVGSVLVYAERWWRFRLRRDPSASLRVDHGLIVRRSAVFQETWMRGAEFAQPLTARLVRRARVLAITTGAGTQRTILQRLPGMRSRVLLPLAPERAAAATVAAVMDSDIDLGDLVGHPVQARNKRFRYALAGGAGAILVLVLLARRVDPDQTWTAVGIGLVLTALALLWATDSYRALGHHLDEQHLIVRSGTFRRATTVMQTRAVIGWTFRQSWFQHRLGLVTMIVPTSAGRGSYVVPDIGAAKGVALARRATPGMLEPHLAQDAPDPRDVLGDGRDEGDEERDDAEAVVARERT